MPFLNKYGVARHIYIPITKAGTANHAVSADWTPAAGDVKISKDGGAAANVTNLPTAIAMGNSTIWDFSLTSTEMQAAQVIVTIADSATKAVDDTGFEIETYGHASAQFAVDLSDAVRFGLTALPNAAAEAAGGLYTRGTGAGQVNQDAAGRLDVNIAAISTDSTAADNLEAAADGTGYNLGGGSVVAASVTAGVTVSTNNDKTGYALTSGERNSVADAILDRDMSTGTDSGSTTVRTVRQALRFLRNKWAIVAGTLTVYKEDDSTSSWTASVTGTAGTDPITSTDPAGP